MSDKIAEIMAAKANKQRAEIERLRADLALEKSRIVLQRGEIERLRAENEKMQTALYRIAGKVPFADDPWTIARNALKGKP